MCTENCVEYFAHIITSNPQSYLYKVDIFILILQMSRFSLKILSNADQSNEPEVSELEFEPKLCLVSNESHDFLSRHNQVSFRNSDKGSQWRTLAADGGFGKIKITPSWLH